MLFTEFNTNYSKLPAMYRKGSVLLREQIPKDADKDAIIPTLPETLPGSKSAKVTPAPDTTTIALQSGPDPISEPVSEAPSGHTTPVAVASPVVSQETVMQEGIDSNSHSESMKRSIDASEAEQQDAEGEPVAGKEAPTFKRMKKGVVIDHIDIIGEKFWAGRGAYILAPEKKKKLRS
jgi:tRNA(His) guanylyltransferase